MTRRIVNLLLMGPKSLKLPVDIVRLNQFAAAYNAYVLELKADKVDAALWSEVERLWARLQ
jgi:hypothetical protein